MPFVDAAPAIEFSLASRGISKGLSQTDGPQFVARPEIVMGSFFVGAYAKNIDSPDMGIEAGVLAGVRKKAGGINWVGSVARKRNFELENGVDTSAWEFVAGARGDIGRNTLGLTFTYSPDELGGTAESLYVEAAYSRAITDKLRLVGNVGRRERDVTPDYTSFNAGLAYKLAPNLSAELRYYDTTRSNLGTAYKARPVAAVRASF